MSPVQRANIPCSMCRCYHRDYEVCPRDRVYANSPAPSHTKPNDVTQDEKDFRAEWNRRGEFGTRGFPEFNECKAYFLAGRKGMVHRHDIDKAMRGSIAEAVKAERERCADAGSLACFKHFHSGGKGLDDWEYADKVREYILSDTHVFTPAAKEEA